MDGAAVQIHDGADQRESQAVAGGAARAVQAHETFEDVGAFVVGDAFAVVSDGDDEVFAVTVGAQADFAAFGGVFDGVVEEVGNRLGDELAVAHDVQVVGDVLREFEFVFFGEDVVHFRQIFADGA